MAIKYGLHGKLSASNGNGKKLADILLKAAEMLKTASGCHLYAISHDSTNPDDIWVTEIWDSKEDHDDSLKNENIRNLIVQAMPLLAGQPEKGQELQVLGGLGVH